jgi:hypothetical protein
MVYYFLERFEDVGLGDSCFLFSVFLICRAFETLDDPPRFGISCKGIVFAVFGTST